MIGQIGIGTDERPKVQSLGCWGDMKEFLDGILDILDGGPGLDGEFSFAGVGVIEVLDVQVQIDV